MQYDFTVCNVLICRYVIGVRRQDQGYTDIQNYISEYRSWLPWNIFRYLKKLKKKYFNVYVFIFMSFFTVWRNWECWYAAKLSHWLSTHLSTHLTHLSSQFSAQGSSCRQRLKGSWMSLVYLYALKYDKRILESRMDNISVLDVPELWFQCLNYFFKCFKQISPTN